MLSIKLLSQVSKCNLAFLLLAANYIFACENAMAQIVPDGTLDTQVQSIDQQNIITGGQEVGPNLFHSFEEFSPLSDVETYFNNNSNIENIFTRVTGGNASIIDGIIRTNDASLFLINPSGIIFSDNAQLNINGSFFATTAEQIIFADGTTFDTQVSNVKPLLTISVPIGLQYGTNPGAISISNRIADNLDEQPPIFNSSNPSNTFALLGGEVTLNNALIKSLSGGRLEIAAVGKGETIQFQNNNGSWEFDYNDVTNFDNIYIEQNSLITSDGNPMLINLRGDNIFINNSLINNFNIADNNGGQISLNATNLIKLNDSFLGTQSGGFNIAENTLKPATQKGGDISINAREIILTNGSGVTADALSEGAGGNINIEAEEYLEISGVDDELSKSTGTLILPSFIAVTASDSSSGSGGNIRITTDRLNITDGGRIDSSTLGTGDAGTIYINARNSITISGQNGIFRSGLYASSENPNPNDTTTTGEAGNLSVTGEAGSLSIETSLLILREGGEISVTNLRDKDGGNITINTDNLVLFDDSQIIANALNARGGNITINTQGLFPFDAVEQGQIQASGDTDGEINISSPEIHSKINTTLQEQSPISPEKLIYSACGLNSNFTANQFRYIGRGGISPSPLTPITEDIVGELRTVENISGTIQTEPHNTVMSPSISNTTHNSLQEATTWIINDRGNVELVAQSPNTPMLVPDCPHSKSGIAE
ncbi:MAG: filamentous hemagglutinin N-terminal domain-containing protein [Xenococcaceae cyanobacterium MO_167.B27]|nr:filamentous hemagglutinin N-terminal domain-containing protein [Xenococcaceae cyanobacterium MO_167.B27]